jgi:hypothetical protein
MHAVIDCMPPRTINSLRQICLKSQKANAALVYPVHNNSGTFFAFLRCRFFDPSSAACIEWVSSGLNRFLPSAAGKYSQNCKKKNAPVTKPRAWAVLTFTYLFLFCSHATTFKTDP